MRTAKTLIWVFAGRTLILLVLSCRGSNTLTHYHGKTHTQKTAACSFLTVLIWMTKRCTHPRFCPNSDNHKFPKYSDIPKNCCNHSKIWTIWLYHRVMSQNDGDGMANSVDPDLDAVCPGISVQKLIMIFLSNWWCDSKKNCVFA